MEVCPLLAPSRCRSRLHRNTDRYGAHGVVIVPCVHSDPRSLSVLLARYGLLAVFAGTILEGETLLLLAGYAAHRGYLNWAAVVGVAWLGAVLGDQMWFWLGRRNGARLLASRPTLAKAVARALRMIEQYPTGAVFAMRFAWGLRTALPVALGMSAVGGRRFAILNALSGLLWAPLVAGVGYLFGAALASHADQLSQYEHVAMMAVVVAALGLHVVRRGRTREP